MAFDKLSYVRGRLEAMRAMKLGRFELEFDSAKELEDYRKGRNTATGAAGFVGNVGGGALGSAIGGVGGGVPGGVAGSVAGGLVGEKLMSAPMGMAYDVAYDTKARAQKAHDKTVAQLNTAAGLTTSHAPSFEEKIQEKMPEMPKMPKMPSPY